MPKPYAETSRAIVIEELEVAYLNGKRGLSPVEVARITGLSHAGVLQMLRRLAADGIISTSGGRYYPKGKSIADRIVDPVFVNTWLDATDLADRLECPMQELVDTLNPWLDPALPPVRCERKTVGRDLHYRLFPMERTISSAELATKLAPLVEGLKAEGRKNMATMSPGTVAALAAQIEKLIDEWQARDRGPAPAKAKSRVTAKTS